MVGSVLGLSERSQRVYRELVRFVDVHGYVPSYVELGWAVGCTPSTIARHLGKLAAAGLIHRPRKGRARSIVIRMGEG